MPYVGEAAALGAALVWSIASMIFQRLGVAIEPLRLNVIKGMVSAIALLLTIYLSGAILPDLDQTSLALIGGSGLMGIGLGDTAFFKTLNCLGPRRTLLLLTIAAPMTAVLAMVTLGETLAPQAIIGIIAIAGGIAWVISDRVTDVRGKGALWPGVLWGLVAASSQAIGVVLARAALADTEISPLWSTIIRIAIGILPLLLWEILAVLRHRSERRAWRTIATTPKLITAILLGSFFGTYLAMWLQQTSIKFAPVGIAQTLASTSPLFVLPLAAWAGDRISGRSLGGVAIVLLGVAMLFLR
jgi:drug/metabolite transporter (DMT)-like permease